MVRPPYDNELRKFVVPEVVFGSGARDMAGRYANNLGARKVLLVSDPGIVSAGWVEDIKASLASAGIPFLVYNSVSPNPRVEEVMLGAEIFRAENCNVIIAVGGGSPIDCAKGIGIISTNHRHILDYEGIDRISCPMPPLICVPTTGSSADVSQFAVIRDLPQNLKIVIGSKAIVPDAALIDPDTFTTMSSDLLACTCLDALTHAIEAFVSNANSPVTDIHALEAIRLISCNLLPAIQYADQIALSQLMLGSLEAGLAFSNAILGAVHSMAHSLGGLTDLPHGECNIVFLKHVIAFNYGSVPERYHRIGEAMGLDLRGMNSAGVKNAIINQVTTIQKLVGLDRTLGDFGLRHDDISHLARNALRDPCLATNPRPANRRDLEVLYAEAF